MLLVVLHVLAFLICLNVQTLNSPLAGAWLFFHLAGCAILLYNHESEQKNILWKAALCWLIAIGVCTFIINPVAGGAATGFMLAAMPSLALCLRKQDLKPYCKGFGGVIILYALGLILQVILAVKYTTYTIEDRRSWPLLDPNNGAAVLNIALVPFLWLSINKNLLWWIPVAVLAAALFITGSKAGVTVAALSFGIFMLIEQGLPFLFFCIAIGSITLTGMFYYRPDLILVMADSFADRFPIWASSWQMLWSHPLRGVGMGMFSYYYQQLRVEHYTGGWYAHNDLLQFAIEMGIPAMLVFAYLAGVSVFTTCRDNVISGVVLLAIFLMSMVEFQFYVPAVNYPLGLALGYHILNRKGRARSVAPFHLSLHGNE